MIKAVIFDMDGLLIDSEPLWREAEIAVFGEVGVRLDAKMCDETMGLRVDQVVEHWHDRFPWTPKSKKEVEVDIMDKIISLVKEKGRPRPGTQTILDFFKKKDFKIALASSSKMILIDAVVEKLGIKEYFQELYSAEFEQYGKPHPGVYLTTAKMLGIRPEESLAFEDSFNGILSAKSARMKCVAVPDESLVGSPKLVIADLIIPKLSDFSEAMWEDVKK